MESIHFNIGASALNIAAGFLFILGFTIYIYRFTLPPVSKFFKYLLIFLRTAALLSIFLLLFEPSVTINNKVEELPRVSVFIDNSQSVADFENKIKKSVNDFSEQVSNKYANVAFYTFGDSTKRLSADSISTVEFNSTVTDFNSLFDTLKFADHISAAVIVTDGNYTAGVSPVNLSSNSPVPLFIEGVGSTLKPTDIRISDVITNKKVYTGKPTTILARINYEGTDNQKVKISLVQDRKIVDSKIIRLNGNGFSETEFSYTPQKNGEQKLKLVLDNLPNEKVTSNNTKIFYLNVKKGKINFLLVSSSPNSDFSFIYNAFRNNEEIEINKLVEFKNKPASAQEINTKIDSADVLGLINYPSAFTSKLLQSRIMNALKSKPFLIVPNAAMAKAFLNQLKSQLGYSIIKIIKNSAKVQPVIKDYESILLKTNGSINEQLWNEAAPVNGYPANIKLLAGTKVLLSYKINASPTNYPMVITHSLNSERSVSIIASELWRWKLQSAESEFNILDSFLENSVKWLNAANSINKINVKPIKRVFTKGEKAEFVAEVFNEKLEPVDNATVEVTVSNKNKSSKVLLDNIGGGLFKGGKYLPFGESYHYSAKVKYGNQVKFIKGGKFTMEDYNIELNNTTRNKNDLKLMANSSKGKYYNIEEANKFIKDFIKINQNKKRILVIKNTYQLWQFESMLILIIIFFSIEWLLRKRAGLL